MTNFETVIRHIDQGSTYSWDLTVLVGLDIALPTSLREKILQSRSTPDEAALMTSLYARTLLARRESLNKMECVGVMRLQGTMSSLQISKSA